MQSDILLFFGGTDYEYSEIVSRKELIIWDEVVATNRLVFAEQVHGNSIANVNELLPERIIEAVDGMITNVKGIVLAIKTADCIPVFLYDKEKKVIAALHAGRSGIELNIIGKCLKLMKEKYKTDESSVIAFLGPAISKKNYPVSKEVFDKFVDLTGSESEQEYPCLDLKSVAIEQLSGVSEIYDEDICTFDDESFFSYRRDKTQKRNCSFIGLL